MPYSVTSLGTGGGWGEMFGDLGDGFSRGHGKGDMPAAQGGDLRCRLMPPAARGRRTADGGRRNVSNNVPDSRPGRTGGSAARPGPVIAHVRDNGLLPRT
jgi:hypothetical protein